MRNPNILTVAFIGLLLFGCAPKIDTSSDDKMKTSIEAIKDKLSFAEKKKFTDALMMIASSEINLSNVFNGDEALKKIKSKLEGKTYQDILNEANKIVKEKTEELEFEKGLSKEAEKELQKIEVKESLLYTLTTDNGFFSRPQRVLKLTVKNNLNVALSSISFNIKSFQKGRSVPFLNDDFSYDIAGGINSGETLTWELNADMFADEQWTKDIPNGYIVVKATDAKNSSNESVVKNTWTDEKEEELKKLKSTKF
jgi:hypothetical protein